MIPDLNEIQLVQTCTACPEQYDAFLGDTKVGYLRLRHGSFTAEYLRPGGELVYHAETHGDGHFEPGERDFHLTNAKRAIAAKMA